jgi:hypothetical protein
MLSGSVITPLTSDSIPMARQHLLLQLLRRHQCQ